MRAEDCLRVSEFIKALTNPLRLRILCVLQDSEKTVSEIVALTEAKQANVSIQLGILRSRGIVAPRRCENNVYYHVADTRVLDVLDLMRDIAASARA